ncbi:MAG: AraC family transcriptional regulator ligand-binding domain-containing protein [Myxococcales bacterium]|nr:AraC family transcriptional regulator ligand-binding domain-containing protein [Myxococcales bacterium]
MSETRSVEERSPSVTPRLLEPQLSARLLKPFLAVLRDHPKVPANVRQHYEEMDPEQRVPASTALSLLRAAEELTGDPDLGLRAALVTDLGDYDVIEYMALSCNTIAEAMEVAGRYIDLVNDAARYRLEQRGDWTVMRVTSQLPFSRAAIDFQLATLYRVALNWLGSDLPAEREVWFSYAAPKDTDAYTTAFRGARVRFGAECTGLVWPSHAVHTKLRTADAKLNQVLRRHADRLLEDLTRLDKFQDRVRALVIEGLTDGTGTAEGVADRLHMSRRTLLRKLEREGTTFKELVDNTRRELALRYLEAGELGASEIAALLGFAQPSAFHRAFKRWTGTTPLGYRRQAAAQRVSMPATLVQAIP